MLESAMEAPPSFGHCRLAVCGLVLLLAAIALACGPSASTATTAVEDVSRSAAGGDSSSLAGTSPSLEIHSQISTSAAAAQEGAFSGAASTPSPGAAAEAADEIVLVTRMEPGTVGAWNQECYGDAANAICLDIASDPLTWIDSGTYEVVPLTGVESWSQHARDRWSFKLRKGVTFHNGEPWDAAAAKAGLDYLGDEETAGHGLGSFRFHGAVEGKVVDGNTLDVVCGISCPILPRTTIFSSFQAPEWWAEATERDKATLTVGLGPYRIVEHVPGVEVLLESFEDYLPNAAIDAQAPAIQRARQVWQRDPLARAAMLRAGEAHWAADIGFDYIPAVPRTRVGTTSQVFTLVADNIWHPELRKREVREALALAVDCEVLTEALYYGLQGCLGNIALAGTVGINASNSLPYGYNPARARQLLEDSEYNPENVIRVHTRLASVYRGLEMLESVVTMWEAVGVNAELVVQDPATARDYRRSGCGQFGNADDRLRCVEMGSPEPAGVSTHYYETVTSNEVMDMQRQLLLRASCHSVNSRVCNLAAGLEGMTFQESIADAASTPSGPERTGKLEALTQIIYDEYWFLPLFAPVQVYGLSDELEWQPRHDGRLRLNSMQFNR